MRGGRKDEKERFFSDMGMVTDRVVNGFKFCMMGNLNRWIEDNARDTEEW